MATNCMQAASVRSCQAARAFGLALRFAIVCLQLGRQSTTGACMQLAERRSTPGDCSCADIDNRRQKPNFRESLKPVGHPIRSLRFPDPRRGTHHSRGDRLCVVGVETSASGGWRRRNTPSRPCRTPNLGDFGGNCHCYTAYTGTEGL